jgi:ribosome-interacting GTPase 1
MPANLPPDYYAAEKRYRQAKTTEEKETILREMLAIMPKHKGTDHLQGDLKRKIAKFQLQARKKTATSRSSGLDYIPREGAGQAVLVGAPNAGKSSILSAMTNARSDVADYPYSTFKPIQGMMVYEDIQVQLVDLPPVSFKYTEPWIFNVVRLTDLVLLVVDLSVEDPAEQVLEIFDLMEEHKIHLRREGEGRPQSSVAVKRTLISGAKTDMDSDGQRAASLLRAFGDELPIVFFSVAKGMNTDELKKSIFKGLHVIRVYTKVPGRKAEMGKPYVLHKGTTVHDAAMTIHKDFAEEMRFARLWGSQKYDGLKVEKDHVLEDGDIVEIHRR